MVGAGTRESYDDIVLMYAGIYSMIKERVIACLPILGMEVGRISTLF